MKTRELHLGIVAAAAILGVSTSEPLPVFESTSWDLTESQCVDVNFDSRDHVNTYQDLHRDTRYFSIAFRKGSGEETCVLGGFNFTVNSMLFETRSEDASCRKGRVYVRGARNEDLLKYCPTGSAALDWVPPEAKLTSPTTRRLIMQFRVHHRNPASDDYVVFNARVCSICTPVEHRDVLVIVGGDTPDTTATDNVELIDLDSDTACATPAAFPHGLRESTSAMLSTTPIVAGGKDASGNRLDEYVKLTSSGWESVSGAFGRVLSAANAVALSETQIMVSGGVSGAGETKNTHIMDISTGSIVVTAGDLLSQKMAFHCSALVDETKLIIGGGSKNGFNHFEFLIATMGMTLVSPTLPQLEPRSKGMCGVVTLDNGEKEYITTGGIQTKVSKASCDRYNVNQNVWDSCPDLPFALHAAAVVPFENTFLIIGGALSTGTNAENPMDQIYKYDPTGAADGTAAWINMGKTMATPRAYHTAFLTTRTLSGC